MDRKQQSDYDAALDKLLADVGEDELRMRFADLLSPEGIPAVDASELARIIVAEYALDQYPGPTVHIAELLREASEAVAVLNDCYRLRLTATDFLYVWEALAMSTPETRPGVVAQLVTEMTTKITPMRSWPAVPQ